ncbi:hypothetical protein [Clostridium magnum]|uniref:hypothetical protein n=1 Tax=Clostridium magnum TaxID=33954 RepID=UPI0009208CEA|nr:hypothetical protein [Clostridium magnum]SHJ13782.1 hypothetical protein SAMN02745944_05424 [Clostridium magnum DSM 2767]
MFSIDDLKKVKSISMSDYFKILKPVYVYLKITPDTSIRNYNSAVIAKTIQNLHKTLINRIQKDSKVWTFECPSKVSFYIYIEKNNAEFYFIVPELYEDLMVEKISSVWDKATIEKVLGVPLFSKEALKYQMNYKKEEALSLNLDKKCNEPLNSIFNVMEIMQEGDRVGVFYNFIPTSQRSWRKDYDRTLKSIRERQPIDREKFNLVYIAKTGFTYAIELLSDFLTTIVEFLGGKGKDKVTLAEVAITSLMLDDIKKPSKATVDKKEAAVLNTQILVMSESKDKNNMKSNAAAVAGSYNTISGDNELKYKRVKTEFNPTDFTVRKVDVNKMSIDECQNLIEIPGRDLLKKYSIIKKVDVLESPVPPELQKGKICIGGVTYKGQEQKAYLSTDKDFKNLTLCLIGPTRAGKTTLISNLARDAVNAGKCTILFDFCGNCDLSDEVSTAVDKVLNIDCSDFNTIQGLGYNEISPKSDNPFELYRCAKTKTSQLMTLINSVNGGESDLKARMERYLEAAALAVFINNGPIKDVFDILQNHISRHKYIKLIPEEQIENLQEYVMALEELDEWSKATKDNPSEIVGTRLSNVQGILNRVNKLKQNAYMELMLKKDCSSNINLVEEMQKPQLICIRMPEVMFSTEQEKDIYCTYWLTKIWGGLQVRKWNIPKEGDRVEVNIVFDELYQVPNCQEFLRSKLSQIAKFGGKPIISCHYLGQISIIRNELKAANSSYMLISGCDKDNFKELKEELDPYTLEDLLNLKRYHSLNLIKYEGGWAKFISKLPSPIK